MVSFANNMPLEDRAVTGEFDTTHWSVVLTVGDSAIPGVAEAYLRLADSNERKWKQQLFASQICSRFHPRLISERKFDYKISWS